MLGDLVADLSRLGLDDRTLVVVTSDHGEAFGEHGFYAIHRTIYEETLRIPLILRYPGRIPARQRLQTPVQHLDIAPTVLGYAGLPLPESLRGESLAPLLSDGAAPPARPVFAEHTRLYAGMVRDGPWKLIVSRPEMKAKAIAAGLRQAVLDRIHPASQELYDLAQRSQRDQRTWRNPKPRSPNACTGCTPSGSAPGRRCRRRAPSTPRRASACARSATPTSRRPARVGLRRLRRDSGARRTGAGRVARALAAGPAAAARRPRSRGACAGARPPRGDERRRRRFPERSAEWSKSSQRSGGRNSSFQRPSKIAACERQRQ